MEPELEAYRRQIHELTHKEVTVVGLGEVDWALAKFWREFFTLGRLIIVAVEPSPDLLRMESLEVRQVDGWTPEELTRTLIDVRPDVVLDAAIEEPADRLAALMGLLPMVAPGGHYLCHMSASLCEGSPNGEWMDSSQEMTLARTVAAWLSADDELAGLASRFVEAASAMISQSTALDV